MSMDFLSHDAKYLLALYLKRMTFEDAYRRADTGSKEDQKEMAYRILAAIEKVLKELSDQGFSPR